MNSSALELDGYVEPPVFDARANRMFLAPKLTAQATAAENDESVNFNVYVLGREGVVTLTMAAGFNTYPDLRRHMDQAYYGTQFVPGKRSADAVPGDAAAEFPLEMIFGGQAIDTIKEQKAKAAMAAAETKARKEADAIAREEAWSYWSMVGLGGLAFLAGSALILLAARPRSSALVGARSAAAVGRNTRSQLQD
jgi:uncharacterized membrane-anchored protein